MDQRQPQPRQPISSSQNLLRPPPHHRPSTTTQPSTPRLPSAPVSAHPTSIISESSTFNGTYPVSIGRGAVIHPRAKIFATEGPVKIGEGCIVSEKCVIGAPPPVPGNNSDSKGSNSEELPITISANVTIGPLATIHPGVYLHSAVVVESHAVINRRVDIGGHSKICARCEIAEGARIKEWVVVWGVGRGFGLRRRVRTQGEVVNPLLVLDSGAGAGAGAGEKGKDGSGGLEGRVIEDARLRVLRKEREALARFISRMPERRK
ncbi:trimeric LpxA-like protein [Aspergillus cavernicola]|uniref:Dynactin subunit 6 n=1 Tax=Aspergillus cavernicola TaxID=176166 RepID=A0ABR4HC49_9EURO